MLKNKISAIIFFVLLFAGSLAVGIILQGHDAYKLDKGFIQVIYWVGKVFALLSILALLYLRVKDNHRAVDKMYLYATIMIQIIPLAVRLLLSDRQGTFVIILSIAAVVIGIGSFIGLYIFDDVEEKNEFSN